MSVARAPARGRNADAGLWLRRAALALVALVLSLGSAQAYYTNTFGANSNPTTTTLSVSPTTQAAGSPITFSAVVSGQRDCPCGPAFIVIDGVDAGSTSAANDQTPVTLTLSSLSVGQHSAYAEFRPTGVNIASHSATITFTVVATLSQANLANTSIENLGQSAHYLVHTTAGVAMGDFANDVWTQVGTLFGEDTGGGSALAANGGGGLGGGSSGAAGNGSVLGGLGGANPATRQGLIQLAQVAQGLFTTAVSGGSLFSGDKQLAAASPGPLAFGSNRPFGGFLRVTESGIGSNQSGAQFGGKVQVYTAAGDYKFAPDWVGGIAASYETGKINTAYNNGWQTDTGVTIGPYVAWHLAPHFVWDAMIGAGWLSYNVSQSATGTPSSGKFNANRYVASSDVTGAYAFGNFSVRPSVGVLTVFELDSGFVDSAGVQQSSSSVRIGRLHGGGELGYNIVIPGFPVVIAPFAKAALQYDFLHDGRPVTANGDLVSETTVSGVLGGGVDARFTDLFLFRLEGGYDSIGASYVSQWQAKGQVRVNLPF